MECVNGLRIDAKSSLMVPCLIIIIIIAYSLFMSMNMKILGNSFHMQACPLNGLGFAEKLHLILEDSLLIVNSFKLSSVSTC